jgi:hypothetical protein
MDGCSQWAVDFVDSGRQSFHSAVLDRIGKIVNLLESREILARNTEDGRRSD